MTEDITARPSLAPSPCGLPTASPEALHEGMAATGLPIERAEETLAAGKRSIWSAMSGEEKRDAVLPLLKAGHSYRAISRQLAAPGRSAIAGLISRLRRDGKLNFGAAPNLSPVQAGVKRDVPDGMAGAVTPNAEGHEQPIRFAPLPQRMLRARKVVAEPNPAQPRKPRRMASSRAFLPLPGTTPVPLTGLSPRSCRWAVDGLMGPSRLFCGAATEARARYCAAHAAIAYLPPAEAE